MVQAIVIRDYGAADVLSIETNEFPAPGSEELHIRQNATGVNFHEVYTRPGLYKTPALPGIDVCEATAIEDHAGGVSPVLIP